MGPISAPVPAMGKSVKREGNWGFWFVGRERSEVQDGGLNRQVEGGVSDKTTNFL